MSTLGAGGELMDERWMLSSADLTMSIAAASGHVIGVSSPGSVMCVS